MGGSAIIDSGTSFIMIPGQDLDELVKLMVPSPSCNFFGDCLF
jgi:hypothetical protein